MSKAGLRKQPKQQRAKLTIERILDAADRLIEEQGLEAVTTNKVAEHANVNIATLYEYFPNKEVILSSLLERYLQTMTEQLDGLLETLPENDVRFSTRVWVSAAMHFYRESGNVLPELMRMPQEPLAVMAEQMWSSRLLESMRRFLMQQRERLRVDDINAAAFISLYSVSGVVVKHLQQPRPYLTDEQLIEELVKLMTGYFYAE